MRIDRPFYKLPIAFDADRLAAEVAALPRSAWIPHPQGFEGNDAVPLIAPGGAISDGMVGPMSPTEHLRACPYIMSVMGKLGGVWGRSRLMGLAAGAEVPRHVDIHYYWRTHLRFHIPVITNPDVIFSVGDESVHMRPGECWTFDSLRLHDVQNGGDQHRVHLVLDTVGGDRIADWIQRAAAGEAAPSTPWQPAPGERPSLRFEQFNTPVVMSPWEIEAHIAFLSGKLAEGQSIERLVPRLDRFVSEWRAAWTELGDSADGRGTFKRILDDARDDLLSLSSDKVMLNNEAPLSFALDAYIFVKAIGRAQQAAAPAADTIVARQAS